MTRVDVAIIGGGPAGSSLAIRLARAGASALVLERDGAAASHQARGEMLSPSAVPLLAALGLHDRWGAARHLPCFGIRSAWGGDDLVDRPFVFGVHGCGWHLDRPVFDEVLRREAADAGATVWTDAHLRAVEREAAGWRVTVDGSGGTRVVHTTTLVDATGRKAALARRLGGRRRTLDHLVALAVRTRAARDGDGTLVEATPDGWWYSAPLPDGDVLGVFLTDADLMPAAKDVIARMRRAAPHTWRRLGGGRFVGRPRRMFAASQAVVPPAGAAWVPVGDAALAPDPLSGDGLLRGLRSAAATAQALLAGDLSTHRRGLLDAVTRYLAERRAAYAAEGRWPDAPFWRRRAYDQSQLVAMGAIPVRLSTHPLEIC